MKKNILSLLLLLLILSSCQSTPEERAKVTLNESNQVIVNAFEKDNFTDINVLRNRFKNENLDELEEFDLLIADKIIETFLSTNAGPEFGAGTCLSNDYEESKSVLSNKFFNTDFLIHHKDFIANIKPVLSAYYIEVLNGGILDKIEYATVHSRYLISGFEVNDEAVELIQKVKSDLYDDMTKLVNDGYYDAIKPLHYWGNEFDVFENYKDAEKYHSFIRGYQAGKEGENLHSQIKHYEESYGIPILKNEDDLIKIVPGVAEFNKLKGSWYAPQPGFRYNHRYLLFENYMYASWGSPTYKTSVTSYGTGASEGIVYENGILKAESYSDEPKDRFNLSGNKLYYDGLVFTKLN